MRITDLRAVQPHTPGVPNDWRDWMGQIAVFVDTDDGITGVGVGGGGDAGAHVVNTVLRSALVGRDPDEIQGLHREMRNATMPFGVGGISSMAVSGVDLALWDLRGKVAGRPIWRLLGGSNARPIPAYVTGWSAEEVIDEGQRRRVTACKIQLQAGPNRGVDEFVEDVARIRSQLGPDVRLMADAFMRLDVDTTLRIAERVEQYSVDWIEEPLQPDDLEGYARLRDGSSIPIAGGEHVFCAREFHTIISERLHQVVQPDVCWCGGLTELLRIYKLGRDHGVRVCPHRGGEVWALPAIAAVDPNPFAESGRPWMSWVQGQPQLIDGTITPPTGPGFGVELVV